MTGDRHQGVVRGAGTNRSAITDEPLMPVTCHLPPRYQCGTGSHDYLASCFRGEVNEKSSMLLAVFLAVDHSACSKSLFDGDNEVSLDVGERRKPLNPVDSVSLEDGANVLHLTLD